jgi:putrescine aminotransferase
VPTSAGSGSGRAPLESSDVFATVRDHISPGLALGYKMIGRGAYEVSASGATVRLSDGRELLDFGSYAVTLVGHRHERVVAAVAAQLGRMPTSTRALANPAVAGFVADLVARTGPALDRVWLGSDGADAVEAAAKLARRSAGRTRLLAVEGAFHGKTLGALALTASPEFRTGLDPVLAPVTHVARDDRSAVAREVAAGDVAALFVEPVQGEAGVRPLDPGLVRQWSRDAHAAGAFVVSDEIQAGMRRCGPFSVALQEGWQPDAVLFGKALGGGVLPLAAAVGTAELFAPLVRDPTWHSATFGGHPLACAAGRVTLELVDELAGHGAEIGRMFGAGLDALAAGYPALVSDVRGWGLLWGLEMRSPALAGSVLTELAEAGLLVSPCLGSRRTIRLLPPMVTSSAELGRALAALDTALAATEKFAAELDAPAAAAAAGPPDPEGG